MRSREIIGTTVSMTDYEEVLAGIDTSIAEGDRVYICCAPASTLVAARGDSALASALAEAAIVTPDGMGVVYAARLLGERLPGRVYGPDLMEMQLTRAANAGTPLFLYGGHDEAALSGLRAELARRFAGLQIAGSHSPPHHELSEAELKEVTEQINASGAQVVWVGIGSPKQEIWMQQMRGALEAPVIVGVGAAFDFLAGRVAQAPQWMQRAGLEWLHRVFQDPLRLGKRYMMTLPRFAFLVFAQAIRRRGF